MSVLERIGTSQKTIKERTVDQCGTFTTKKAIDKNIFRKKIKRVGI